MGAFTIGSIFPFINSLTTAAGAARNVFHIIDRIPDIDPYSKIGIIPDYLAGQITFHNVSFAYPTRSEVEVRKSFNNLLINSINLQCRHLFLLR